MTELDDLDMQILYLFRKLNSGNKRKFVTLVQELPIKEQKNSPDFAERGVQHDNH